MVLLEIFASQKNFMEKEVKLAKEIITEEIKKAEYEVLKIILFGSRAIVRASQDSD